MLSLWKRVLLSPPFYRWRNWAHAPKPGQERRDIQFKKRSSRNDGYAVWMNKKYRSAFLIARICVALSWSLGQRGLRKKKGVLQPSLGDTHVRWSEGPRTLQSCFSQGINSFQRSFSVDVHTCAGERHNLRKHRVLNDEIHRREWGREDVLKIKMQAPFLQWAPNNFPTFYKLQTILHFHSSKGNTIYTASLFFLHVPGGSRKAMQMVHELHQTSDGY